jgi:hypothetical protein
MLSKMLNAFFSNSDQTTTTGHGSIAYNLIHCNGLRVGVCLHVPLVHAEHVGANQPAASASASASESESESELFFSRVDTEMFKQVWAAVGDREVAKSTIIARQAKSSQTCRWRRLKEWMDPRRWQASQFKSSSQ